MEEMTNLPRTEASTGRGQEVDLPPASCTGAGVGEHLGGVQVATEVATSDEEDLGSGAVMEDRELAALGKPYFKKNSLNMGIA